MKKLVCLLLLLVVAARAAVAEYPIPAFAGYAWIRAQSYTVEHDGEDPVWVQPEPTYAIIPADKAKIWVPPEPYIKWIDEVPTTFKVIDIPEIKIAAEIGYRDIPGEYETLTRKALRWVDATTKMEAVPITFEDVWIDTSDYEFFDGYVEIDNGEGGYEYAYWWGHLWIESGYWDVEVYGGGEIEVEVPGYEEEYDEEYTVTLREPEYDVPYEISPEVIIQAAGQISVVDVEGVPGHYDEGETPGYWIDVDIPEKIVKTEYPGYWTGGEDPWTETIDIAAEHVFRQFPPSTLSITHDGQDIQSVEWSTGIEVSIPSWIDGYLNDPDWLLEEDENDENNSEFNAGLAFSFVRIVPRIKTGQNRVVKKTGGGGWGLEIENSYPTAPWHTVEEAEAIVSIYLTELATILSMTRRNPRDVFSCVAYVKSQDPIKLPMIPTEVSKFYSGRTSGWGTPDQVMKRRDYRHAVMRPNFLPGVVNAAVVTRSWDDGAYCAMRGREQNLIDWYDLGGQIPGNYDWNLSHSENARPSHDHPHGTRGVRKNNPDGREFHICAQYAFGYLWEYTGDANTPMPKLIPWPPKNLVYVPFSIMPSIP